MFRFLLFNCLSGFCQQIIHSIVEISASFELFCSSIQIYFSLLFNAFVPLFRALWLLENDLGENVRRLRPFARVTRSEISIPHQQRIHAADDKRIRAANQIAVWDHEFD